MTTKDRSDGNRSARLETRVNPAVLALLKRAAGLQGRTVSDFVVAAAQEAAQRTIEHAQLIQLTAEEQERFVDLLLNPPALPAALKRAQRAHARLVVEPK
jgi:uncharacterized protein (DUF1778 family)